MKYFNKTRTIEQKVTDREMIHLLERQTELLNDILIELKSQRKDKFFKKYENKKTFLITRRFFCFKIM